MTDDEARTPVDDAQPAGQSGERTRRSRRRGKRSKNKSTESQPSAAPTVQASSRQPESTAPSTPSTRGSRKTAPARAGYQPFNDGLDRFVCLDCLRFLPEGYPVQHRRGVATAPLREVARRDAEILLCNELHSGGCTWPDGGTVEPPAPDSSAASEVVPAEAGDSPVDQSASPELRSATSATGEGPTAENDAGVMPLTEAP